MKRSTVLATTATTITALTAGCTSVLGGSDSTSCPESPTPIESLEAGSRNEVTVAGTVTEVDENAGDFTVDGDTGSVIVAGPPFPSTGACVEVTGRVSACVGCGEDTYYLDPASWDTA